MTATQVEKDFIKIDWHKVPTYVARRICAISAAKNISALDVAIERLTTMTAAPATSTTQQAPAKGGGK